LQRGCRTAYSVVCRLADSPFVSQATHLPQPEWLRQCQSDRKPLRVALSPELVRRQLPGIGWVRNWSLFSGNAPVLPVLCKRQSEVAVVVRPGPHGVQPGRCQLGAYLLGAELRRDLGTHLFAGSE
jgi:hypothetical protein